MQLHALAKALSATALALAAAFVQTAAAAPVLSVSVSPASTSVGSRFIADVTVADVVDLYAWEFDLSFNGAVVNALSVAEGDFLSAFGPTVFFDGTIDNTAGTVSFNAGSLLGAIAGGSGSGLLARFEFEGVAVGSSALQLGNANLLNSALAIIGGTSFRSTEIRITPASPAPLPSPGTLALALPALLGLAGIRLRQQRSK